MGKRRRKRNPQIRRPRGRPPRPILLPECDIQLARGLHTADGYTSCLTDHKRREARIEVAIGMEDLEALKKVEPCFGTPPYPAAPKGMYRIARRGKLALELSKQLSITTPKKQQLEKALKTCQEWWRKGYRDRILP